MTRLKWIDLNEVYIPIIVDEVILLKAKIFTKEFPQISVLKSYIKNNRFDLNALKKTDYYKFHCFLRENNINPEVRTDNWIYAKAEQLIRLYNSIKEKGYLYTKPIKVKKTLLGYQLLDGGHRVTCLYILGYKRIKMEVKNDH